MMYRWICSFGVLSLLGNPIAAQFGIAGNRKQRGTTFQDLNEAAQQQEEGAGGFDMNALGDLGKMQEMFNDPAMAKAMEDAMQELANMSPEQIQAQMQQVMGMLTNDDMVDTVLGQKDEILKQLEDSGLVAPDEVAKYKADPEAFEKEMRQAFGQMQEILGDGDLMKQAMKKMADPLMKQVGELMESSEMDEDKIEEVRLELLSKPELVENNPLLKSLFDQADFKESLSDPSKWRDAVREGQKLVVEATRETAGAGVGEL